MEASHPNFDHAETHTGCQLEINALTFSFPECRLFEEKSLSARGAAVCCGGNGTGKTTLLRMIAGLLPPIQGSITLDGKTSWRTTAFFDTSLLFEEETVGHHLLWSARLTGESLDASEMGLDPAMRVRHLSAGKRQLLALRLVCAMPADMIVADEPFAHLDAAAQRLAERWFECAWARGCFVLLAMPQSQPLPFHADVWAL